MSGTSVGAIGQQGQQTATGDAFQGVDLDDFVKLLITELQHQDPLSPMENHEILQQITQIREIDSNQRLSDTLEAVLLGQSLSTASSLLGQNVEGLSEAGDRISGQVDRVSIEDGNARLHVGEQSLLLGNVEEILPEESTDAS